MSAAVASAKKEAEDCDYQVGQIITLAHSHTSLQMHLCAVRARESCDGKHAENRFWLIGA